MIEVSPRLLQHGRLLPVQPKSKKPLLRSVIRGASNDPKVIARWQRDKRGCGWGLRIDSTILIVLDLERPGKGSVCGGVRTIDWIECDRGERLPFGPVATTQSGGEHRYYRLPAAYIGRITNRTQALPGIDIKVRGGMVVIPTSCGRMWVESPDDVDIPELPGWFCDMLVNDREPSRPNRGAVSSDSSQSGRDESDQVAIQALLCPPEGISKRDWFRVFHSKGFLGVWTRRTRMPRDNSDSAYEFSIAERGLAQGLSSGQVLTLIRCWWQAQGTRGDEIRFGRRILPAAETAARPYIEQYRQHMETVREEKQAGKTKNRIINWLTVHGPATPARIAAALGITREAAKKQLSRLAGQGILAVNQGLYSSQSTNTIKQEPVNIHRFVPAYPPIPTGDRQTTPNTQGVNIQRFVPGRSPASTATPPAYERQPVLKEFAA